MKFTYLMGMALCICLLSPGISEAQLLKKAKEKLEKKGNEAIDDLFSGKKKDKNSGSSSSGSSSGSSSSGSSSGSNSGNSGNPGYGSGSGNYGDRGDRKLSRPDVDENIAEAYASLDAQNYSDAKFAIQQAIIGIEYELGEDILENMPTDLLGLSAVTENDQITSTGMGFVGLNISREYDSGSKWAKAMLANNSALMSSYNMVLSNPAYAQQSDDYKVTRINGYKAIMEYDNDGLKVAIPFGQSSLFLLETSNVYEESEAEEMVMQFDIASFKEILGEQ